MSKHTPGPWKVRNGREVFKGNRRICHVNAGEQLPIGLDMDRAACNARLIAAAPDLLQALIECLECEFAVTDKSAISNARAAIAKATDV